MDGQELRKGCEDALKSLIASKEVMESGQTEISHLLYQRYTSLIESGFTPEQAFELIKARGLL